MVLHLKLPASIFLEYALDLILFLEQINLKLKLRFFPEEMTPILISVTEPPLCNTVWSTEDQKLSGK